MNGRVKLPLFARRAEPVPPEHPRAGEAWFRNLPQALREQFVGEWRSGLARDVELVALERRRALRESIEMAALFALGDVVCPGGGLASGLIAAALGALLGLVCNRLDAERLLSATIGSVAFLALQWSTRDGLSPMHMLVSFPFGCACAYLGYKREERGSA